MEKDYVLYWFLVQQFLCQNIEFSLMFGLANTINNAYFIFNLEYI